MIARKFSVVVDAAKPVQSLPMSKPEEMKKSIIALLRKEGGQPLNKSELARELELPGSRRKELRMTIAAMLKAGEITQGQKCRYSVEGKGGEKNRAKDAGKSRGKSAGKSSGKSKGKSKSKSKGKSKSGVSGGLVGKLKVNAAGHGWFFAHKTDEENLATGFDFEEQDRFYVSPGAMGIALDGDIVRAKLVENNGGSKEHNDMRARVVEIVERRSSKVTGIFVKKGKFSSIKTKDERLPPSIRVSETLDAKEGQLVAVEITEWIDAKDVPKGKVVEVLGWPGDPGVDVEAIVHQHGINATFPSEVVEAAQKIPMKIPAEEIARREDWRKKKVITIDPKTAKDFDDGYWLVFGGAHCRRLTLCETRRGPRS
jgi:exoribonuclease R